MQYISPKRSEMIASFSTRQRRIYDFLTAHHTGVLSTVTSEHRPHGTVIYYGVDGQFVTYFLTKSQTKKHENITFSPCVMLTIYDLRTHSVAQISGVAEEVSSELELNGIAEDIWSLSESAAEGDSMPIAKLDAGTYTAYKIKPVQIRLATYARSKKGGYKDLFESIESFDLES